MQLISRYESRSDAEERAAFLRSRGIATHVTDMHSMRLNLAHQGRFRAGLWVLLEDQYDDAARLLEDPDHEVRHPLSEEEMHEMATAGPVQARRTMIKWLLITVAGLIAAAVLVVEMGGASV